MDNGESRPEAGQQQLRANRFRLGWALICLRLCHLLGRHRAALTQAQALMHQLETANYRLNRAMVKTLVWAYRVAWDVQVRRGEWAEAALVLMRVYRHLGLLRLPGVTAMSVPEAAHFLLWKVRGAEQRHKQGRTATERLGHVIPFPGPRP